MPHLPESDPKLPPGALSPKIGPLTPSETPKQEMARLEQILLDPRYTVDDRVGAIGRLYDLDKTKEHYSVFLADMIGSARSPEMVDGLAPLAEKYPNPVVIDRFMGGFLAIENIEMRRAFLRALRPHIKQRKDIFEQLQGWSGETSPELKQEWEEAIREGRAAFGGADGGR
ncbi:MAG: hypothetical protein R3F30_14140 [Planctomycetota bacterium]